MPVVRVECNYKLPAKQGDIIRVVSTINEMPKARIIIYTTIFNEEQKVICDGSVTLGFIHSHSRKPTRVPTFVSDLFAPYFNKTE